MKYKSVPKKYVYVLRKNNEKNTLQFKIKIPCKTEWKSDCIIQKKLFL